MKKSARLTSYSAELSLDVSGSEAYIDGFYSHDFWKEYVIGELDFTPVDNPDARAISVTESDERSYNFEDASINCDANHAVAGIKFAAHYLEQARQKEGVYTVHGNVISLGNSAVALTGGISGIGKTSLSSHASQNRWNWVSDEKFLINEHGLYVGGLSTIQNDEKTLEASGGARPYLTVPENEISAFVIPIIADQKLVVHQHDDTKAAYHYYEELGRNITAGRAVLRDYPTPLLSLDTPEIARRRYQCAQDFARRVPMYMMLGSADSILEHLETNGTLEN